MSQSKEFFERLYQGYEAEALVAGGLFGRALEAFRLPGDFGFDLVVSNALALVHGSSGPTLQAFPWLLQVKSRRMRTSEMNRLESHYGQFELRASFLLKEDNWAKIKDTPNSFLVLVLLIEGELPWGQAPKEDRSPSLLNAKHHAFIWFSSNQLTELETHTFLERRGSKTGPRQSERRIEVRYLSRPTGQIRAHFSKIVPFVPDDLSEERRRLLARLPEHGETPMNRADRFEIFSPSGEYTQLKDENVTLQHLGEERGTASPFLEE